MAIYDTDVLILLGKSSNSLLVKLLNNKAIKFLQNFIEFILIIIINLPIPIYHTFIKILITSLPGLPSIFGCYLRGLYYKPRLKKMGRNVFIEQGVIISFPKNTELDDFSFIDKYVIVGSKNTKIGRRVHIAPFSFITGGGNFEIEDYACIANHSSIITSTETLKQGTRASGPMIPSSQRDVIRGFVHIKKDAFIGTKSTILTNVTIGEGSVVAAGTVITKDTEPWMIYVSEGGKAKIIKERTKLNLEEI